MGRNLRCCLLALGLLLGGIAPAEAADQILRYAGVNLSGAEFKPQRLPGRVFKDYTYPQAADFSYFASAGMNIIRLPFLWERLQPALNQPLDVQQLGFIRKAVDQAKADHLTIILDLHNFGRYRGAEVGTDAVPDSAFADLWKRLAQAFAGEPAGVFGLMNEPAQIPADRWARSAEAGIAAVRDAGARNLVLVSGSYYSGAHSWEQPLHGVSNADAFAHFRDPASNFAFEAHQYFDRDYSGTEMTCADPDAGVKALKGITRWLRQQGHPGFLGEFGVAGDPVCLETLRRTLAFISRNKDAWLGWSYWAAGDWWGNYPFNVQPDKSGVAKPQMAVLAEYAKRITSR